MSKRLARVSEVTITIIDKHFVSPVFVSDECVEVTPAAVRLRKVELDANARARTVKRLKHARA